LGEGVVPQYGLALPVFLACCLAATSIVAGNVAIGQKFDGPNPLWQLSGDRGRILEQACMEGGARNLGGCERIVVAGPVADTVVCACRIDPVAVLDELEVRLWVKASRPDVRLAARVALPRSVAQDGRPAMAIVRGTAHSRPGAWQQLVLKTVPALLAAEVRVMRTSPGAKVDPRQACIDAVLLMVPGEPNGVEILTDELDVDGVVVESQADVQLASFPPQTAPTPAAGTSRSEAASQMSANRASQHASVRLQGSVLLVEGRPFAPRAIEWQNEPLKFLAERGFNTVWLQSPPTADQIAEAARHSLWFLCTAPRIDTILGSGLGQPDDRVVAWVLNDPAVQMDVQYGRQWAETIRRHDAANRPIIMAPALEADVRGDIADLILAGHPRAATMRLSDYAHWLESRLRLVRPGTPLWVEIPTQFSERVSQQAASLSGTLALPPSVDADRVAALVRRAWTSGCRGIVFRSVTPLDDGGPQTRRRAAMLELINRHLQLIEPWVAGGKLAPPLVSTDGACRGVIFDADRTRLIIPMTEEQANGFGSVPTSVASGAAAVAEFVVPGVPVSSEACFFSPSAVRPLPLERIAGGMRFTAPVGTGGMVLITEDRQIVQGFRQRIARDATQVARLNRDYATERAKAVMGVERDLNQLGYRSAVAVQEAAHVSSQLRRCEALLAAGRPDEAYDAMEFANQALWRIAAEQRRAVGPATDMINHPLALSCEQLVAFATNSRYAMRLRGGENLLYGGDFEDLGQMTQFGWKHVSRPVPGIDAHAKLSTTQPHSGRFCVQLSVASASPETGAADLSGPAVWIISPGVPVVEGQVVEITGWVRVDAPLAGSIDGFQVLDTLGGPELALAIRRTSGWQPFQMLRAVPQSTELHVSFALAGIGSASIDGVMVRTLTQRTIRRLPPVSLTSNDTAHPAATTENAGPLFVAPGGR
jgi:hypothetical protein